MGIRGGQLPLKLQQLQNKILRTTGNLSRRTPIRDLYEAFRIPYIYDFVIKLCREQSYVIQNYENVNNHNIGQDETQHRKYKRLKLGGGQTKDRLND